MKQYVDQEAHTTPKEEMLIATFQAQEAISTMISTAGAMFTTYADEIDNFKKTKRWMFDIVAEDRGESA